MEKLLVTGSSGELGKTIIGRFSGMYDITGIDIYPQNKDKKVDIRHYGDIYRVLDGIDYVVHAAALHGIDIKSRSRLDFFECNVMGTFNLLEASLLQGVKKIIFISSSSVYGSSKENETGKAWWLTEESNVSAADIYDATKIIGEKICEYYSRIYRLSILIYRVARFYVGPDQNDFHIKKSYMCIDVNDVAEAINLGLRSTKESGIYNIASITPFQYDDINELFNDAPQILRKRDPELFEYLTKEGYSFPASIKKVICADKAKHDLGFRPIHSFRDIL